MSCLLCGHVGQFNVGHLNKDGKEDCGVCEKCVAIVRRAESIFEQLDDAANNMEGAADKLDKQGFDPIWVDQLTTLQEHLRSEAKECFDLIEELKPESLEERTRKVNDWMNGMFGNEPVVWVVEEFRGGTWKPHLMYLTEDDADRCCANIVAYVKDDTPVRVQKYRRRFVPQKDVHNPALR